jgi:hypothetical protein
MFVKQRRLTISSTAATVAETAESAELYQAALYADGLAHSVAIKCSKLLL